MQRTTKLGWSALMSTVVFCFLVSGVLRLMGDGRALATTSTSLALAEAAEESDFVSFAALNELIVQLNEREATLDERDRLITLREKDVSEAKRVIEAQLATLLEAEERLTARMAQSAEASGNDLETLTQVYQAMKPTAAAELFAQMEPTFAAEFLARMSPEAAAQIFTHFSPEVAYALTAVIAGRNANAATE